MSSSQIWSPILEHTGGLSGNLGVLRTFPSRSNVGGYVHANLNNPSILDGVGVRGRYQGRRFNIGADLNARFPSRNPPSYGLGVSGGANLGRGWNLGGALNTQYQRGRRPDYSGGLTLTKKFGKRRRRSIVCMTRCVNACKHSSEVCQKNCIVAMC